LKAYFLLGRALHIVQDSFSLFHGKRQGPDFHSLVQVNSYVCTPHTRIRSTEPVLEGCFS
jgi:hypothetical protein